MSCYCFTGSRCLVFGLLLGRIADSQDSLHWALRGGGSLPYPGNSSCVKSQNLDCCVLFCDPTTTILLPRLSTVSIIPFSLNGQDLHTWTFVYSVYVKDNTFYESVLFCKFLFSGLNPCYWDGILGPQTGTQCFF